MESYGGFHVVTDAGARVNAGFVVTARGTVAIDAMMGPEDVHALLRAAEEAGAPPVRYAVITHGHPDHVLGAGAYDCDLIASRTTAAEMARLQQMPDIPPLPVPHLQFEEAFRLELGDVTLELRVLGGHAPGLAALFNPETRAVWASDLIFAGRPPFIPPHADVDGWLRGLDALAALDPAVVVPGHGKPGGPELIQQQQAMLQRLLDDIDRLAGGGLDADGVTAELARALNLPERMVGAYRGFVARRLEQA